MTKKVIFESEKPVYIFKICLIGSAGVGKTSIAQRLCCDTFDAGTKLTIGIDFYTYDLPIIVNGENTFVMVSIWEFGEQRQFRKLFPYYICGANGIFLVFDLTQMQSLINLDWWYDRLEEHNMLNHPKTLIGTKLDLVDEESNQFKVNELNIEEFLNNHDEKDFIKTSAMKDINIRDSFKKMIKKVLDFNNLDYQRIP
ncbi:MAG: Rab family GTPase [Promethearchaeota archaeon]